MRFRFTHKLVTYLLVAVAFASVALGGEVPVALVIAFVLAMAASWFFEPDPRAFDRTTRWWNRGLLALLALVVADALRGGVVLEGFMTMLLALTVSRLFSRRTNQEYRQIAGLSFLMLLLGTLLNNGISFAPCFFLYIVLATWDLVFLHLRREMEENYLLKHSAAQRSERVEVERILNSRRVVGGSFLGGTALISVGVFLGATAIFALFPRIGLGFFLGAGRSATLLAGFAERVQLGQHGLIKDNPEVVMRVRLADRPAVPLRFRGAVFDRYEAGTWQHAQSASSRTLAGGRQVVGDGPPPWLVQDVFLEPLDSAILFAADRPVAVDVPERGPARPMPAMSVGHDGELRWPRYGAVRYRVYSSLWRPDAARLRAAHGPFAPAAATSLQLPADLPASIRDLAARLAAGRATVAEKVDAVARHLAGYRYTVDLVHDPARDPLEEFLFATRAGHCEYFSTAMAVLLRAMDVPARNVNGFLGGEWNAIGGFLAVRQGDSHSWVEVFYPGVGWVTHDPTPPAGQLAAAGGGFVTFRQALDTLHHHWLRWVIDYNLDRQAGVARRLARALRGKPLSPGMLGWRETAQALARAMGWALGAAFVGWAVWRFAVRVHRRSGPLLRPRPRPVAPIVRAYRRMLATLAKAGLPKRPAETPREFADRLAGHPGADIVARVTDAYYRVRYGGEPDDAPTIAALAEEVARLRALTTSG
jgi:transglutaminase-like putative cysteine protease